MTFLYVTSAFDHVLGIRAGMFVRDAKALYPDLVIFPYNFEAYEEVRISRVSVVEWLIKQSVRIFYLCHHIFVYFFPFNKILQMCL